jgi:hypothetical protein
MDESTHLDSKEDNENKVQTSDVVVQNGKINAGNVYMSCKNYHFSFSDLQELPKEHKLFDSKLFIFIREKTRLLPNGHGNAAIAFGTSIHQSSLLK